MSAENVDIYDLRGLNCPLPVLKTRKRLSGMEAGARLWIWTTDPLAVVDVPAFCSENGHKLIRSETMEDGHRFLLEKG